MVRVEYGVVILFSSLNSFKLMSSLSNGAIILLTCVGGGEDVCSQGPQPHADVAVSSCLQTSPTAPVTFCLEAVDQCLAKLKVL